MTDQTSKKLLRLYSNSKLDTHRACMRKGYYTYSRKWVSDGKNLDTTFGSAWHAAMDVIWSRPTAQGPERREAIDAAYQAFISEWVKRGLTHPDEMSPDDIEDAKAKTPHIAQEMLYHYYDAREHIFLDPSFKLLDVERPFAIPLDPEDDSLFYVGKIDKVFEYRGKVIGGEHKTTGAYSVAGTFRRDYIDSFSPNSQIDGYLYALHKLCAEGVYGEHNKGKAGEIWVDAALTHKKIHDGFKVIPISRRVEHLDEWLWTTLTWVDQIEANQAALRERSDKTSQYLVAFPQNTTACNSYRGCVYRDFCKGGANPEKITHLPLGFVEKRETLFDTIKLEQLGFTLEMTGEKP